MVKGLKANPSTLDIATAEEPNFVSFPTLRGWEEAEPLFKLISNRGYIAGGFAAYMGSPIDNPVLPGDIDIFAVSEIAAWDMTVEICRERGWTYDMSPIAYTIRPSIATADNNERPIQVVIPDPAWKLTDYAPRFQIAIILESFDLNICRGALLDKDTVVGYANMGSRIGQILVIRDPVKSMRRVLKYMRKGVQFSDEQLYKLFLAHNSLSTTLRNNLDERYNRDTSKADNYRIDFDTRWLTDYVMMEDTVSLELWMQRDTSNSDLLF